MMRTLEILYVRAVDYQSYEQSYRSTRYDNTLRSYITKKVEKVRSKKRFTPVAPSKLLGFSRISILCAAQSVYTKVQLSE